jgi:hypothetical protein
LNELAEWLILDRVEAPGGSGINEDAVGCSGNLAWVIDGATPLSRERLTYAPSDARWLVDFVQRELRTAGEERDPRSLEEIIAEIAQKVRRASGGWRAQPKFPPSAALGLARNCGEAIEYFVLADVVVAVDGRFQAAWSDDAVDRANVEAISSFEETLRATGSYEQSIAAVRPLMRRQRETRMNVDGGYWVLADDPRAAERAIRGSVRARDISRVLLCTDGFARAVQLLQLFGSWADFFAANRPLGDVLDDIRSVEANDPECLRFPRWSVSDDASALLLTPSSN